MKIENPLVTLADDARIGVEEEVRSGFLDWLMSFSVEGDDGMHYELGGSILSLHLEKMDLATMIIKEGYGAYSEQLRGSVYRICRAPKPDLTDLFFRNPQGTLRVERREHSVHVTCGKEYTVECFEDNSWHIIADACDGQYKIDVWHRPYGYPLWYGRETPSYLTQHSITYGYNWSGDVEGDILYKGKTVHVKGSGLRERYVAVDSSAAELGGWEDWGYFTFNEVHSSLYDMRLGMKDFSVYNLLTGKHYTSDGSLKGGDRDLTVMDIMHEDWAFYRPLDGFIPMTYRISIKLEDGGLYEVVAKVGGIRTWGVTFKVPDNPVATLDFSEVTGKFTDKDGNVTGLTGGCGILSVRQWHQYPNLLPRELYSDEVLTGEKFDTL